MLNGNGFWIIWREFRFMGFSGTISFYDHLNHSHWLSANNTKWYKVKDFPFVLYCVFFIELFPSRKRSSFESHYSFNDVFLTVVALMSLLFHRFYGYESKEMWVKYDSLIRCSCAYIEGNALFFFCFLDESNSYSLSDLEQISYKSELCS